MELTPQEVREAREALAALPDRRAVQIHRWLSGNRRKPPEIDGQTAIDTPRPEVCPECQETVCDTGCDLAARMGWPTEATKATEATAC